jgi:hypothetical protein
MGTTLTGTTPQDTYDSLIKVTDNGPIGTSLKTLTDGLGNDSALALSSRGVKVNTSATLITDTASLCHFSNNFLYVRGGSAGLSIGDDAFSNSITLADNADIAFETGSAERMRITAAGNVGIGTTTFDYFNYGNFGGGSISQKQSIGSATDFVGVSVGSSTSSINFATDNALSSPTTISRIVSTTTSTSNNSEAGHLAFFVKSGAVSTAAEERFRVTANGVTFNGDTAAANALDDYEEGIWTMGITFGGASVGVTYGSNTGQYTKVGRKVTVTGQMVMTNKGSSTGIAKITGLPFTSGATSGFYSSAAVRYENITYAGMLQSFGDVNSTDLYIEQYSILGVGSILTDTNFANNSSVLLSLTYFV